MDPLPPETTTPMPPTLHREYDRELGWPGRPEDNPKPPPPPATMPKPHIRIRNWPRFIAKMSVPINNVET